MAKHTSPMRLNENLVSEAQVVAVAMHRSVAEQIEYWSEMGKRLSATLTPQQAVDFMQGQAKVVIESQSHVPLDVLALSDEVAADSRTGELVELLLAKGQTLYAPAPEGGGLLSATFPGGVVKKGRFVKGQFKPLRKAV